MKLTSITIEGMHNVLHKRYTFNDLSYLYGRNGAGKSTALQAIQLAILGYIPGTNKTNGEIFRHANSHTMAVTAILNDNGTDVTMQRVWTKSGASVKCTVNITPDSYTTASIVDDMELPIFNFSEFIGMSANRLKDWFIDFLPKGDGELDWTKILTEAAGPVKIVDTTFVPYLVETAAGWGQLGTGVDYVRNMNDLLKSEQSAKKAELTRLQSTIQSLVFYDDCDPMQSEDELYGKLRELQTLKDNTLRLSAVIKQNAQIKQELEAMSDLSAANGAEDATYLSYLEQCSKLTTEMNGVTESTNKLTSAIQSKQFEVNSKQSVINSKGVCQYTKEVCPSIAKMIDEMSKEVGIILKEIADLNEKKAKQSASVAEHPNKIRELTSKARTIETRYARRDMLRGQVRPVEAGAENVDLNVVDQQIADINELIIKCRANKKYSELSDTLVKEKYKLEQNLELIKLWLIKTGPNGLQSTMMVKPFEELAGTMTGYIRKLYNDETMSAHFDMSEKANSFTFGLIRDNVYVPFDLLSSGEKCIYTLAMMMCLVQLSTSNLKLILVDDLLDHLDEANVTSLFESLQNVKDIQIILAGVQKCTLTKGNIVIEVPKEV